MQKQPNKPITNMSYIRLYYLQLNKKKFELQSLQKIYKKSEMDRLMQQVNKLVVNINKNADENTKQSIRSYADSLFRSQYGDTAKEDPNVWKAKIMNKIQQNYDNRSVLQCQQACNKFINNNVMTKKSQVLKMLFKLSQHGSQNFSSMFNGHEKNSIRKDQKLRQTQVSFNTSAVNNTVNNTSTYNPNQSIVTNISMHKPTFALEQLKRVRERGSEQQGITQSAILKQLTFRLQGIRTQSIITSDSLGQSTIKPNIQVSDTVRKMVKQLSEIGWLFNKITEGVQDGGAIAKALRLGVRQQMSQYYRWLAVIENMIRQEQLTLRKLILWSYEPFQKLKWMAIVLQAAKPFQGCQIISIINSYRPQGSNSINQLLNRILTQLLQPLFQYIYNWVYRGELIDSQGQFFVCVNKIKNSEDSKECFEWVKKFYLEQKYIPNLLDYQSAVKIFNAGKTLYFLKKHCKIDYILEVPFFDVKTALNDKLYGSTSILSANFKSWLSNVSKTLSNFLVEIMFNKFDLKKHFNAIKMFYLAGKGDFIQTLIDSLKDQLSKPKHQIAEHNLQRFISDAMSQCFPKISQNNSLNIHGKKVITIEEQILARLTAKKVQNGSEGWDVFNFQYSVEQPPLNTIFSTPIIQKYQKIFNFLWKVKRVEQSVKQLWLSSFKDYRHEAKLPILHECQVIRQQMFHFVNNLHGYLMISIQSAWNIFSEQLNKAKSFDEILQLQDQLISQLIQITLNTPKAKQSNATLGIVFSSILSFASVERQLVQAFSDYTERNRQYTNRRNLIKRGLQYEEELQPPYFNSAGLQAKIKETKQIYRKNFDRFYDNIKKQPDSRISTLGFRLDFSGFYCSHEFS